MDSLNYGAFVASQYARNQSSDINTSFNSPPARNGEDNDPDDLGAGAGLSHQGNSDRSNSSSLSSLGAMSGAVENAMMRYRTCSDTTDSPSLSSPVNMSGIVGNAMMLYRASSDTTDIAPKRRRGRPRKLNPDGSFATSHIPLSSSIQTQQFNRRFSTEHPRNLIPELCRQMYEMGWMAGTGGSFTIRQDKQIYITPSGVSKERILPQDLFVLDDHGNLLDCPIQEKNLKMSDNAVVFLAIYAARNAGSIIHSHSPSAVLITLICKDKEFRISNQETIKGMMKGNSGERYSNTDTLVVPIIENLPSERDLEQGVTTAMQQYPLSNAVLIRRHGIYVWGDTWKTAKGQAECLDYLFDLTLDMRRLGIDPTTTSTDEQKD